MPRQKGTVLTERDRALLGYLGVARYVTGAQAHRLLAPDHDKAITSRRLARLCEFGPNPGDDSYLRRLEYRRSNSLPFPVWTLTPHGRAVAEPIAPGPVAAVQPGVGILFIERILVLNELLIALILASRRSESAPLTDLPFRWRVADEPLRFQVFDRVYSTARPAVLRPGAIVDLPGVRRRIFLEPELGTTSLAPADPRQGHVKRRLERYTTYFLSFAGRDLKQTLVHGRLPGRLSPRGLRARPHRVPPGQDRAPHQGLVSARRCSLRPARLHHGRCHRRPHAGRGTVSRGTCALPSRPDFHSPDCARPRHRRGPQAPPQGWDQVLRRRLQLAAEAGVGPRRRLSQTLQARPGTSRRVERVPRPRLARHPRQAARFHEGPDAMISRADAWMTADEATAYLGYRTRAALYQAVRRGIVPAHRLGARRLRFRQVELDAELGRQTTRAPAPVGASPG